MSLLINRIPIARRAIQSGMIVQFDYQRTDGVIKKYTVLVIDPDRKNLHASSAQLHAYELGALDDTEVSRFMLELEVPFVIYPKDRVLEISQLDSLGAYESYKTTFMEAKRAYRTFIVQKILSSYRISIGITNELTKLPNKPIVISNDMSRRSLLQRLETEDSIVDIPEIKEAFRKAKKGRTELDVTISDNAETLQDVLRRGTYEG